MIGLLLVLSCDSDPCAWAYGEWSQVETVRAGEVLPTPGGSLVLAPEGFGYRPDSAAPVEPAVWTLMDPACETASITWNKQTYTLSESHDRLVLEEGPSRRFVFERAD